MDSAQSELAITKDIVKSTGYFNDITQHSPEKLCPLACFWLNRQKNNMSLWNTHSCH